MYAPTPTAIAQAFDLGRPNGELVHVRRGDTDTWRLETDQGSYFIKGYFATTTGQFTAGDLVDQLKVAMAFERLALDAGIKIPEPIAPTDPSTGWLTRLHGRLFRAYKWIDHRPLEQDDDVSDWLGGTMARIHQLEPPKQAGLPNWWCGPLFPRATWEDWIADGSDRGKSWPDVARERLPSILDVSSRIEEVCVSAPDCVTTHGDFKTHNMLMTPTGPVLVDWDSVRTDSAALEAGRVAYLFAGGELRPIQKVLDAYLAAGGDIAWTGQNLFLSVLRHHLHGIFERILVSLERRTAPWWMGTAEGELDQAVSDLLRDLPNGIEHLDQLAASTSPPEAS